MKPKNAFLLSALALAALCGEASPIALPGVPGSWVTERALAPRTIYGSFSAEHSLRLDAAGAPHVVYGGDRLFYAFRDGGGWHPEVADARPGVGDVSSLGLDAAGHAHIAYRDVANNVLRYTTNASGTWSSELVASGVEVPGVSVAVDGNGKVHVAYQDFRSDETRYATNASGSWVTTRLDGPAGLSCSIALDANGRVHVSYVNSSF